MARPVISVLLAAPDAAAATRWERAALGATVMWDIGSVMGLDVAGAPIFLGEPEGNGWDTPLGPGCRRGGRGSAGRFFRSFPIASMT